MFLKYLVIFISLNQFLVNTQNSALQSTLVITPNECNNTLQYYDSITLSCKDCPSNSTALDGYNCKCNKDHYFLMNNGGESIDCAPCPTNFTQSFDGFDCVICDELCHKCSDSRGFLTEYNLNGKRLRDSENNLKRVCIECDSNDSRESCVSCKTNIYINEPTNLPAIPCSKVKQYGGMFFSQEPSDLPNTFTANYKDEPISWYYEEYLRSTYIACITEDRRNVTACQATGNMCVLNLYSSQKDKSKFDACSLILPLGLPLLKFAENYRTHRSRYIGYGADSQYIKMNLKHMKNFYIAEYNLSGKLHDFKKLDITDLQQCNKLSYINENESNSAHRKSCTVSVENFMENVVGMEPMFYELYIAKDKLQKNDMIPVPVRISTDNNNYDESLYKRFFLFDALSSKKMPDSKPVYIRYASSITIYYELVSQASDGEIYPPVLFINYKHIKTENNQSGVIELNFISEYRMNYKIQSRNLWISVGVFLFLGLLWSFLRTWNWNSRSGKYACDLVGLFKFFTFFMSSVGTSFFLGLVGSTIYYFVVFYGQTEQLIFLPMRDQEKNFKALITVSFVLKFIDVLNTIFVQTSYEMFFIDWERPKNIKPQEQPNPKLKLLTDIQIEAKKQSNVSCWRKLFVANEWNEIQTMRKTSITFQVFVVLLLLQFVNLERFAIGDNSEFSRVLRIAIASLVYLSIGIFQWLYHTIVYTRFINDKLGKFVDFCSISNISVFILTHNQFGYYIHGKSPHGKADSTMSDMIEALAREEKNLMTQRGLELNSNHQTFSFLVNAKLSKQYGKAMRPLIDTKHIRNRDKVDNINFENKFLAYSQLNRFLIAFIEKISRDIPYCVIKRNLVENILDIELKDSFLMSYFFEDDTTCFSNTILYGCEQKFFSFELSCFLFVDYFAENYLLAGFILYIITKVLKVLRSDLGKRNLARKTLVDKRFLL